MQRSIVGGCCCCNVPRPKECWDGSAARSFCNGMFATSPARQSGSPGRPRLTTVITGIGVTIAPGRIDALAAAGVEQPVVRMYVDGRVGEDLRL